jgi:hypothetical protein
MTGMPRDEGVHARGLCGLRFFSGKRVRSQPHFLSACDDVMGVAVARNTTFFNSFTVTDTFSENHEYFRFDADISI